MSFCNNNIAISIYVTIGSKWEKGENWRAKSVVHAQVIQVKDFSRRDEKMLNVNVRWMGGGGKRKKKWEIRNVERNKGNKKVQEDGWVKKKEEKDECR